MGEIDYGETRDAIRADLRDAHRHLLERLASSGTWWNGRQRAAIAAASRHAERCTFCARRKAALSPQHVDGQHDSLGGLPAPVVEVAHRLRTDPGRLSRAWFEGILAAGLSDGEYVELVGIVAMTAGLDYFARALGVPPFALPEPRPGEPSRYRPSGARPGEAWVPMIAPEDAVGAEQDLYGPGFVPNIVRALSLVPDEVRTLWKTSAAHYLPVEQIPDPAARRTLDRMQMELVAARVSALNQCFY